MPVSEHPLLSEQLGSVLTVSQVAEFMQCHPSTIYRNYKSLGGIRVGSSYRFFEKSLINAVLERKETALGGSGCSPGEKISLFSQEQDRSQKLGSSKKKRAQVIIEDRHNLLD